MCLNLFLWWCASWVAFFFADQLAGICDPFIFSPAVVLACDLVLMALMELLFRNTGPGLRRAVFRAARLSAQLWAVAVVFVVAAATIWPFLFRGL